MFLQKTSLYIVVSYSFRERTWFGNRIVLRTQMFSVHIVRWDYISCVFQLCMRMVYSLARDIHATCGMVRQKRKEEKRKTERKGGRRWRGKEVESDGVLQGGGVILRHWHKQLLYCKSLEVRLPFRYSRTWFESSNTGNKYLARLRQYYVTCFIIVRN